jgi:hypothetical protein
MIFVVVAAGALAKEEPASGEFDTASYSYGFTFDQNGYSYYPSWVVAEDDETADVAGGAAATAAVLVAVGVALIAGVSLWRARKRRMLALI